jgi:hypothetical protein
VDARQDRLTIGDIAHGQCNVFLLGICIFEAVERKFAPSGRQAGRGDKAK